MTVTHKHNVVFVPCLLLLFPLILWVAVVSGDSGGESAVGTALQVEECTGPGTCSRHDTNEEGGSLTLRALLQSFISKRTLVKRGKQDSGIQGFSSAEKQAIVRIHNQLRQSVNPPASDMLQMSWSDELERVANNYAKTCNFQHNPNRNRDAPSFSSVGENIYAHSNSYDETGAVQSWYDEVQYYDYDSNSCSGVCGHYTQVVWAKSNKVGCGVKFCNPLRNVRFGSGYIIVCNYGPAGNYRGVKPYEKGQGSTSLDKSPDSPASKPSSGSNTNTSTKKPQTKKRKNRKGRGRKQKNRRGRDRKRKSRKNRTNRRRSRKSKSKQAQPFRTSQSKTPTTTDGSSDQKRQLSRTCRRGRRQTLDLKNELEQDMKSLQPGSSPWRQKLSGTCRRGRERLEQMKKALQQQMGQWNQPQNSPTSSGNQPSSSWRRSLSSKCRRGRRQTLQLKNDLEQDMKGLQPGTSPWRVRLSSTCGKGRQRLAQLRNSLLQSRNQWG